MMTVDSLVWTSGLGLRMSSNLTVELLGAFLNMLIASSMFITGTCCRVSMWLEVRAGGDLEDSDICDTVGEGKEGNVANAGGVF